MATNCMQEVWVWEKDRQIGPSVPLFGINRRNVVMPNSDTQDKIVYRYTQTHDRFLYFHTF